MLDVFRHRMLCPLHTFGKTLVYLGYKATIIVLSCLHCNEYALLFCWFTLTDLSVRILYFDFMSKGDLYFDINVKSCDVFWYRCQKLWCILISMSNIDLFFDNFLIDCDNFSARSIGHFMDFIWILNQRVILKCIRLTKAGIHKWIQFSTFSSFCLN